MREHIECSPYDTGKFHGIPVGADSISARHCKMCKYIGGKTMKSSNIPEVKLGIIAVSRDCFPIALSEKRRAAISAACAAKGTDLYECKKPWPKSPPQAATR